MATIWIRGLDSRDMCKRLFKVFDTKFDGKEKVPIAGVMRPASALAGNFAEIEAHFVRADQQRAIYRQAVADRDAAVEKILPVAQASISWLELIYGGSAEKLAEAGIPPKKDKRELTTEEKFIAAKKREKTRVLRHTMGKRQKAKVKATGEVNVTAEFVNMQQPGSNGASAGNVNASSGNGVSGGNNVSSAPAGQGNQAVPPPNGANPITGQPV